MRSSGIVLVLLVAIVVVNGAGCASSPESRFYDAVREGDVVALDEALGAIAPESQQGCLDGGLRTAASTGNSEMTSSLLAKGASVDSSLSGGTTALILAAGEGHSDVVALLLEQQADPNAQQYSYRFKSGPEEMPDGTYVFQIEKLKQGVNALAAAVANGHVDTARILLEHGVNPNKVLITHGVEESLPALGLSGTMDLTVRISADVQYRIQGDTVRATYYPLYEAKTVLHIAVENDDAEMAKLLMQHGSDPDALDNNGNSPLDIARDQEKEALMPILRR